MKQFLFSLLLCLPTLGAAEPVDISDIPSDFAFSSAAEDGDTFVAYLGREGDLFKFSFESPETREDGHPVTVWTNSASQTVKYENGEGLTVFSPHDCAPGTGSCRYTVTLPDGEVFQFLRSAFRLGDIEIGREYLIGARGEEILFSQSCTTFDQYGFWIDGIRYDSEGVFSWDKRANSSVELVDRPSYEQIRKVCKFTAERAS